MRKKLKDGRRAITLKDPRDGQTGKWKAIGQGLHMRKDKRQETGLKRELLRLGGRREMEREGRVTRPVTRYRKRRGRNQGRE